MPHAHLNRNCLYSLNLNRVGKFNVRGARAGIMFALVEEQMRHKMNKTTGFLMGALVVFGLTFSPLPAMAQQTAAEQPDLLESLPVKDREMVIAFRERVKDYAKLREAIEAKMPKLAKESTPEQIQAHKTEFEERVRAARAGAKGRSGLSYARRCWKRRRSASLCGSTTLTRRATNLSRCRPRCF
jgi:hypothetical protein